MRFETSTNVHHRKANERACPRGGKTRSNGYEADEERVRERTDWTSGVIAQFAIIAVGAAVGFVVIALFLPLVTLISALT